MLKIIALGTLGYIAYRVFNQETAQPGAVRLAGGPLSSKATVQSSPDVPPPG
ncbi:hypothetical protein WG901_08570 [Novosphingobium sp. PS1R-30]|uniref:Uncharacterized protein n=1 Tax=Novosphingobium anseongense TaxID=3133436 RepID=A0ABU8RUC0_9SPHN